MRNSVVVFVGWLVGFPLIAFSQIGLKAGVGISDIAFRVKGQAPYLGYEVDELEHRLPKLTYQAGLFATIGLGKRWGVQPELLFITQGLDYSISYPYDDITYKLNLFYMHMPVLIQYQLGPNTQWHPALMAGPYASVKLGARRITEVDGIREKTSLSNMRPVDFGLAAGFGTAFHVARGQLVLDFRATYSLVNVMDRVEGYVPDYYGSNDAYARNMSIVLTLGYRFKKIKP